MGYIFETLETVGRSLKGRAHTHGLSNFRATSLAFERLLRRNDERVAYSIVVSLMYSL